MNGRQGRRYDAERMVFTWSRIAQANRWHRAPARFGVDSMIWVIGAILDVVLAREASTDANERLVRAAAAHGDQRRLQGSGEDSILDEYRALASALQCRLHVTAPHSAVMRIDGAMPVVIAMALEGYHRSDREPTPSWADQLEAHIAASSLSLATLFQPTDPARGPTEVRETHRGSKPLVKEAHEM